MPASPCRFRLSTLSGSLHCVLDGHRCPSGPDEPRPASLCPRFAPSAIPCPACAASWPAASPTPLLTDADDAAPHAATGETTRYVCPACGHAPGPAQLARELLELETGASPRENPPREGAPAGPERRPHGDQR